MNSKKTLCISRTICWNCKMEFKAAYAAWERGEKRCICSPESFSEEEKTVAAENGVIIKAIGYPNGDIHTANICPHCGRPFGNKYIKDLVAHKEKEIVMHNSKEDEK